MPEPDWAGELEARLTALGIGPLRREEIRQEVRQHLADAGRSALTGDEIDQLIRGLAPVERRSMSDASPIGDRRTAVLATIWRDIRYAARTLARAPGYTGVALATLALGIGANAAIFTVADAVLLRPYAYPQADRIVLMNEVNRAGGVMSVSWPDFEDWAAQQRSFAAFGVYRSGTANLTGGGTPERLAAAVASSGVFGAMGLPPLAGRAFAASDDRPGAPRSAILSYRLWRDRFGAAPDTIGRSIVLDDEPHVIIGVMPAAMEFPTRQTDVWLPLGPAIDSFPARGNHPRLFVVGRLMPEMTLDRAAADMDAIARRLEHQYPQSNANVAVGMTRYADQVVSGVRPALLVLLGAVGFVLLIGCANVANLTLARGERRQREMAVRAALGAERGRIVQQLITESLVLAAAGGVLGFALATWIVRVFVASQPTAVPRIADLAVDGRAAAFAAALAVLTALVVGLVPALRAATPHLMPTLNQAGRGSALAPGRRLRSILVVAEIALALVLLVGAGLTIVSFARLISLEPGFDPGGVVTMRVTLPPAGYRSLDRWLAFHDELLRRVSAVAGATEAGINSALPLGGGAAEAGVIVEGRPPAPHGAGQMCVFQATSRGYFRTMGIPLLRGRGFGDQDRRDSTPVAIVDDSLVRTMFPGEDPLGKRISFEFRGTEQDPQPIWREIVGVVGHVRQYGLASEPAFVQIYTPFHQLPYWFEDRRPSMALVARTSGSADALVSAVRREVAGIDPDIPLYGVETMDTYLAQETERPRLIVVVLAGLGGLALTLAVIGVYGVVWYSVAQRTQEIGVRMALGATRREILTLIVRQAGALIAAGVIGGTAASLALASVIRSLLFGVSPRNPATVGAIALVLAAVALAAAVVPALRATRVDPLTALRTE